VAAGPAGLPARQLDVWGQVAGLDVVTVDDGDPSKPNYVMENDENRQGWIDLLNTIKELHSCCSDENPSMGFSAGSSAYGEGSGAMLMYPGSRPVLIADRNSPDHAANSNTRPPTSSADDPRSTGWLNPEGMFILNSDVAGEDSVANAKQYTKWLVTNLDRLIPFVNQDPLHNLPPWESVQNSDAYRNSEPFQQSDNLSRWLDHQQENIIPGAKGGNAVGRADPYFGPMAATYAQAQMMNAVLVQGQDASDAFDEMAGQMREQYNAVAETLDVDESRMV
jgi:hypothetical protein